MDFKTIGIIIIISIPFLLLTNWALMDIIHKKYPTTTEKVVWWFISLIPFLGFIIYLIIGFRRGVKMEEEL